MGFAAAAGSAAAVCFNLLDGCGEIVAGAAAFGFLIGALEAADDEEDDEDEEDEERDEAAASGASSDAPAVGGLEPRAAGFLADGAAAAAISASRFVICCR